MKRRLVRAYRGLGVRDRFYQEIPPKGKVLDLGCGAGYNGLAMREIHPGIEVWGVDVHAGEGVPEFYEYRVADLDAGLLPHPDATFDAVVFMHVIEHLRSPLRLGPEIARVMKPGGRLYVEAPNRTFVLVPSFSFCRGQHNPFNVVGAEYSLETGLVEFLDVPGRD